MAHVTTKNQADVSDLGCPLGSCLCCSTVKTWPHPSPAVVLRRADSKPYLGSRVKLALVAWIQENQPQGQGPGRYGSSPHHLQLVGELAQALEGCSIRKVDPVPQFGSIVELDLISGCSRASPKGTNAGELVG